MMDWTTRHCRYFMRLLSRHTRLYTEMITTGAILHGNTGRWLDYNPSEHPIALQIGGSDPRALARAARLAEQWGYDEINLNCGCPSERVRDGRFGACLMAEPELVADCLHAMREAVGVPVTVKTRLGIDDRDDYEFLARFVAKVRAAGCRALILHARKAWLSGLSPQENREIPPLVYERVYRTKRDFPDLEVVLNGGIRTLDQAARELGQVDGVMIGREACENPYLLAGIDVRLFGSTQPSPTRRAVVAAYRDYAYRELAAGTPLAPLVRHLLGLFHGEPGARRWRRTLSELAHRPGASIEVVDRALTAFDSPAPPLAAP
jgi:tRNA-dihydrouridine synthase A